MSRELSVKSQTRRKIICKTLQLLCISELSFSKVDKAVVQGKAPSHPPNKLLLIIEATLLVSTGRKRLL